MVKTKSELLAELDSFLALRTAEVLIDTFTLPQGDINEYKTIGVETRANERANKAIIHYYVFREGLSGEQAYYQGDPIGHLWRNQVHDFIEQWNGEIIRASRPHALCRIIETAAEGEKYILVTETAPQEFMKEDTTIKEFAF